MYKINYFTLFDLLIRNDFLLKRKGSKAECPSANSTDEYIRRKLEDKNYIECLEIQYPSNWCLNRNTEKDISAKLILDYEDEKEIILISDKQLKEFHKVDGLLDQVLNFAVEIEPYIDVEPKRTKLLNVKIGDMIDIMLRHGFGVTRLATGKDYGLSKTKDEYIIKRESTRYNEEVLVFRNPSFGSLEAIQIKDPRTTFYNVKKLIITVYIEIHPLTNQEYVEINPKYYDVVEGLKDSLLKVGK